MLRKVAIALLLGTWCTGSNVAAAPLKVAKSSGIITPTEIASENAVERKIRIDKKIQTIRGDPPEPEGPPAVEDPDHPKPKKPIQFEPRLDWLLVRADWGPGGCWAEWGTNCEHTIRYPLPAGTKMCWYKVSISTDIPQGRFAYEPSTRDATGYHFYIPRVIDGVLTVYVRANGTGVPFDGRSMLYVTASMGFVYIDQAIASGFTKESLDKQCDGLPRG